MVQFSPMMQTTLRPRKPAEWAELHGWRVDRSIATSLSRQIYQQVRQAVLSGALAPGSKLPSSRIMAAELGVARASVVAAYEQLLTEGYASGHAGSGTFVAMEVSARVARPRRIARPAKPPEVPAQAHRFAEFERSTAREDSRPFNTGRTLIDARTAEVWRRLTHRAVRAPGANHLGYTDPRGFLELRESICDYLRAARSVRCEPEQIVVTSGTQHAIDIAIRVLLSPGDDVWVEDPGYALTHEQLLLAKARLHPIPVDRQGIVVAAGYRLAPRARAAFVTPSHQFPTGVAMTMARRLALLDWARSSGAFIIEDDYTNRPKH